jgi:putative membrane protein
LEKANLLWGLAFGYVVYAGVGDLPAFSSNPLFSTVTAAEVFVILYLVHSYINMGVKEATKFLLIAAFVGYSMEYLFITTGLLGKYVYLANLAPFIGPVPAAIPLLWASLGYFCLLAGGNYLVSAALMMLLDISFDPKFSVTLWNWVPPGQYYGVPVANFVGWFFTALIIFALYRLLSRNRYVPSWRPVSFYLLIGLFIGAIPDLVPGLYGAGEVALALFAAAAFLLFLLTRRVPNGAAQAPKDEGRPALA